MGGMPEEAFTSESHPYVDSTLELQDPLIHRISLNIQKPRSNKPRQAGPNLAVPKKASWPLEASLFAGRACLALTY